MTSEFIEKRLEGMKTTIPGYDFYELAKLAKDDPEEFEKRRRQLLEAQLAKGPEDSREKDRKFMEKLLQSHDPGMDVQESIVRSMIAPLQGIGNLGDAGRDCVAIGASSVEEHFGEDAKARRKIIEVSNSLNEGVKKLENALAAQESKKIPDKQKH